MAGALPPVVGAMIAVHGPYDHPRAGDPYPRHSEIRWPDGTVCTRSRFHGERAIYRYDLLEPAAGHSTITYTVNGAGPGPMGYAYSRPLPADIDALPPMSDERIAAWRTYRAALAFDIADAIHRAYPELAAPHHCAAADLTVSACEYTP